MVSVFLSVNRVLVPALGYLARPQLYSRKWYSSTGYVTVEKDSLALGLHNKPVVATVTLNHSPVNSLSAAFTVELTQALKEIEDSNEVNAILLKSSLPEVFCSGLDLKELYGVPRESLESFWRSFRELWFQLYSSKLFVMSVINGHCLAGGTILAAACDYRIGVEGQYSVGITAAKVGLVTPPWLLKMLCHLMGHRPTEHALQTGRTFSPTEALSVGLIDRICSSDIIHDACMQVLTEYLSVSQESRSTMKKYLREDLLNDFERSREHEIKQFVDYMMRSSVQENLGKYIQKLKQKV